MWSEGGERKNMPRATSSWPSAFQRSSLWLCCLRHIATNASNGGATSEQPCPEESVRLLIAAPSWDYTAPPSLILKYRGRGGDPVSSGKMTTETGRAPGQQITFSFSKGVQSLFKSKRNKDVGKQPRSL